MDPVIHSTTSQITVVTLRDISKAFDTISPRILLIKHNTYI